MAGEPFHLFVFVGTSTSELERLRKAKKRSLLNTVLNHKLSFSKIIQNRSEGISKIFLQLSRPSNK